MITSHIHCITRSSLRLERLIIFPFDSDAAFYFNITGVVVHAVMTKSKGSIIIIQRLKTDYATRNILFKIMRPIDSLCDPTLYSWNQHLFAKNVSERFD